MDSYVEVCLIYHNRSENHSQRTKVVRNSLSPSFNESLEFSLYHGSKSIQDAELKFKVMECEVVGGHHEPNQSDQLIGTFQVKASQIEYNSIHCKELSLDNRALQESIRINHLENAFRPEVSDRSSESSDSSEDIPPSPKIPIEGSAVNNVGLTADCNGQSVDFNTKPRAPRLSIDTRPSQLRMLSNDAPSTATPNTALLRSNTNGFMEIGLEFKPHQQVVKVTVVSATGVRAVNFTDPFSDPYVKINVYRNNRKLCQEGKTATLGKKGHVRRSSMDGSLQAAKRTKCPEA